jgi:MoaA/NifB/PqqE/SkfB family radical SAM enzyme
MVMQHDYIKLAHSNPSHEDWFVVNWCLGNTCNFECSYCPDDLHSGSVKWPEIEQIKQFMTRVAEQVAPRKVYYELTGGEVTLYKHFTEICQHATALGAKVGLISNGSRTLRWWEDNKQYFDHVCLSFHPEFADAEHFVQVVKLLNNDVRTHVNIMMSPEKFDFCYAIANKVKTLGNISMALQPLIHDFGDTLFDYDDFQKKIFDKQHELIVKHIKYTKSFDYYRGAMKMVKIDGTEVVSSAHRFISQKTNDWSGWKCYSGAEQIVVDLSGDVFRGWCKVGGKIGNIFENFEVTKTPVICNKTMCHCNFDIMSTKEL